MIRDRSELLIDSITKGEALTETRSRFEEVISAIAAKIGEISGGGSSGVTRELIGSGYAIGDTKYTTTKSMADYDYIEIHSITGASWSTNNIFQNIITLAPYSVGNHVSVYMSGGSTSTSQNERTLYSLDDETTITRVYTSASGDLRGYITEIYGVKY